MSPVNPKQRLWFVIISLLVVVIIVGSYLLLTGSENESIVVLSPDEVINDSAKYVGKTITVEGYFYTESGGVITSSLIPQGSSAWDFTSRLPVNYSAVNVSPAENVKYRFTGVLIKENSGFVSSIVLVADKIVRV